MLLMNSLAESAPCNLGLSWEAKIAESRSYCKNELGFTPHFIDFTSLFFIHSGWSFAKDRPK